MKRGEVSQGYKDIKEIMSDTAMEGRDLLVGACIVHQAVREGAELVAKGVFAGLYFGLNAVATAIVEKVDDAVTDPLVITDPDNTLLIGEWAGEDFYNVEDFG